MNELATKQDEHFTLQQLADLLGQNATTVGSLAKQMGGLEKKVNSISAQVGTVEASVSAIKQDIKNITENEEITYAQQENIRKAVRDRVYDLLKLPEKKDDWTLAHRVTASKYRKLFFKRCYQEVQLNGHLRQPYRMTAKKDYDIAMQEITSWYPKGGPDGLKQEADEIATANKIAAEQGYK